MKGFTLIEILITIFLIAILASFFVSVGLNFYKSQQLDTQTQAIIQTLRRAQSKAMSVEMDSSFGVYLTSDNYTLFKGDSYATRDIQYDEVFDLPQIIKISGLSEIVFLKVEGLPKGTPAFCGGICTPCSGFSDQRSCRNQGGCSWFGRRWFGRRWFGFCLGTCTPCDSYQNQAGCEGQSGCIWYPSSQGGNIILSNDGEIRTININEMGRVNLQ